MKAKTHFFKKVFSQKCFPLLAIYFSLTVYHTHGQKIEEQLAAYQATHVAEKVYLQLDRRSFRAGEELWFKGYVFETVKNRLSYISKVLTVGLMDKNNEVIFETSFAISGGRIKGGLNLPEDITTGNYLLFAYTNFMEANEIKPVFYSQVQIEGSESPILSTVELNKEYFEPADILEAQFTFTDNDKNPLKKEEFIIRLIEGEDIIKELREKSTKDGIIAFAEAIPSSIRDAVKLTVSTEALGKFFEKVVPVSEYDKLLVDAFPEGGYLIPGALNNLAFKATDFLGNPIDITGELVTDDGIVIQKFSSFYGGMGKIPFIPEPNQTYLLRVNEPVQSEFPVQFDVAQVGLQLDQLDRDTAIFNVLGSGSGLLKLVGIQNGVMKVRAVLTPGENSLRIPLNEFSRGIVQFTLFEEDIPVSERLVFVNQHQKLNINIYNINDEYATKAKVSLQIEVTNADGVPTKGIFSASVADEYFMKINRQYQELLPSYLLLSTELKGKIPTPNYYFGSQSSFTTTALDLVMMTHGWRRYTWDAVLNEGPEKEEVETSGDLIATVVDKRGNAVANAEVQIVNTSTFTSVSAFTDNQGNFVFPTALIPQRENLYYNLPNENMQVIFNEDDSFLADNNIDDNRWEAFYVAPQVTEQSTYAGDDYEVLSGVEIRSTRIEPAPLDKNERYELANQMSVRSHYFVESRTIDDLSYSPSVATSAGMGASGGFIDIVRQFSNIYRYNGTTGQILLRPPSQLMFPSRWGAVIVLNGSLIGKDLRALNYLNMNDIEKVEVIKTSAMAIYYGSIAANGAVMVTTKKGIAASPEALMASQPERVTLKVNKEFYSPNYEDASSPVSGPDFRKTLHWVDEFKTDEYGKATLEFFTDAAPKTATIIIQGTDGLGNVGFAIDQFAITSP